MLRMQISQVCQLCQQSPRLFTNHAAQLHTLLVSIFTVGISGNMLELLASFSLGPNKAALWLAVALRQEGGGAPSNETLCPFLPSFLPSGSLLYLSELHG